MFTIFTIAWYSAPVHSTEGAYNIHVRIYNIQIIGRYVYCAVWQQPAGKICDTSPSHSEGGAAAHWMSCPVLSGCPVGGGMCCSTWMTAWPSSSCFPPPPLSPGDIPGQSWPSSPVCPCPWCYWTSRLSHNRWLIPPQSHRKETMIAKETMIQTCALNRAVKQVSMVLARHSVAKGSTAASIHKSAPILVLYKKNGSTLYDVTFQISANIFHC